MSDKFVTEDSLYMTQTTVAVIGLGYIGLPTAVMLARGGCRVIGVDVTQQRVDLINQGKLPFVEEGLEEALAQVVATGALSAQTETPPADAYIVAVPTPFIGENHDADLSYIMAAAEKIAPQCVGDELIILESTSPPGTTEKMAEYIFELRPELSANGTDGRQLLHFAHAPERVLPGKIMTEMVNNDRIIGGMTPEASTRTRELYATFCEGEMIITDARTAEMAKLTENSFRDVNIAFANELSILCERLGIDVWELIELANHHPRVNILQPGPGVGGHCIAVDPWFIVSALPNEANLIRTAREVNDSKPQYVINRVTKAVEGMAAPKIACLGIAFKANIDDLRESPSLHIVQQLRDELPDAKLLVVEPNITELPPSLNGLHGVELRDAEEAIREANVVLVLVDHDPFKELERTILDGKTMIDTKGIWDHKNTQAR